MFHDETSHFSIEQVEVTKLWLPILPVLEGKETMTWWVILRKESSLARPA